MDTTAAAGRIGELDVPQILGAGTFSRRHAFAWALAGTVLIGAAVRFPTLGLQSYHHDEIVTVAKVLPGSLHHMLAEVRSSESTPPLYYFLAWIWAHVFGLGEVGLRSLSAICGIATIPVAYLIGNELGRRRVGLPLAAMVAVNPMLIWYSQEARAYSLMVLLGSAALLFFLRARRTGAWPDLLAWAACSALAIASHYFAAFPVMIEAGWLVLASGRRHRALAATCAVGLAALPLVPLALAQASHTSHIDWFAQTPLLTTLRDTAASFMIGETGRLIAQTPRTIYALAPGLLIALGIALVIVRGQTAGRRRGLLLGSIAVGAVLIPVAAALAGKNYIMERNLLPALVPLLAVVAIGFAVDRARRVGLALASLLVAGWLVFAGVVAATPSLQRPDWHGVAVELGPPAGARATVTWSLGMQPLSYYLRDGSASSRSGRVVVKQINVITIYGGRPQPGEIPAPFKLAEVSTAGNVKDLEYRSPVPTRISIRSLRRTRTGFRTNGVLVDGPPPGQPLVRY